MRPVSYWRKAHKRNSVRALMVGTIAQAAGGAWASMPGSLIDRLPVWVPFSVSGAIFAFGLWSAYMHQTSLEE